MNFANMSDEECKAYNDAVRHAARRAFETNAQFWVYRVGATFYVRQVGMGEPEPIYSVDGNKVVHAVKKVCIAQRWDDRTVQLRFDGARSEWVNF